MSYCQHQLDAKRLICLKCGRAYDVTHADTIQEFVCVWCKKERVSDVNGVPMDGP